ncbi:MAG TPA: diacylglycerol kinase family protein [Terriglobales bacterium]|nr:diacylglycerol kinase family protein [Terriglobales bacterium]
MRAAAILGPNARPEDVRSFNRPDLGVLITQAHAPQPDADAVLIVGGDGTIHRHLHKLIEMRVPLLPVPGGSANDFARAVGLRKRSDAINAWEKFCRGGGNVRELDVGVITPVSGDTQIAASEARNSTYFCNIGGAGLDANTNRRVNGWPRWVRAHGGYVVAALQEIANWRPAHMRVWVPDTSGKWRECISEPATFVAFANSPAYGDGMKIAPRAKLDDGLLDVCFVRRASKGKILTFFPTVFFGAHLRLPEVEYFQVPALRLETERPMNVYADGEYVCKTPVEVRVVRCSLRVIYDAE